MDYFATLFTFFLHKFLGLYQLIHEDLAHLLYWNKIFYWMKSDTETFLEFSTRKELNKCIPVSVCTSVIFSQCMYQEVKSVVLRMYLQFDSILLKCFLKWLCQISLRKPFGVFVSMYFSTCSCYFSESNFANQKDLKLYFIILTWYF